jgi:hypothetical protein
LTTSTGAFSSADIGKHGVAVQWNGASAYSCSLGASGWGCWNGVSCEFTVASINSATSINVTKGAYCGASGIGFTASGNAYWALYTDDSIALYNALTAASNAGVPLYVPSNYHGGIITGRQYFAGFDLQCAAGGTFYNPHLSPNSINTWIIRADGGSGYTINGCTFSGTEPTNAAWQDAGRNYDLAVIIENGTSNVSLTNNIVENFWGTYEFGTNGTSYQVKNALTTASNSAQLAELLLPPTTLSPTVIMAARTAGHCLLGSMPTNSSSRIRSKSDLTGEPDTIRPRSL